MKAKVVGNDLQITIPMISPPRLSSKKKVLLVATSSGGQETEVSVDGKPVTINVNAYIAKG